MWVAIKQIEPLALLGDLHEVWQQMLLEGAGIAAINKYVRTSAWKAADARTSASAA